MPPDLSRGLRRRLRAPPLRHRLPRLHGPLRRTRPTFACPLYTPRCRLRGAPPHRPSWLRRLPGPPRHGPPRHGSPRRPPRLSPLPGVRHRPPSVHSAQLRKPRRARRPRRVPPPRPPRVAPAEGSSLSDTQVLKMLESRRPESGEPPPADVAHGSIPLLKPDDTGTRRALKEAVVNNAPVSFAVQLQWSVQPAELDKVPPLAIFSAYTLYTVEGSRDGRKWYGLRLGFFSDALSAKQVAHYVRSEFTSVAVVPVSPQEKGRATDQDTKAATLTGPVAGRAHTADEFKLIDDDTANKAVAALLRGKPLAAAKPGARPSAKPMPKVAVGRAVRQPGASAAPAKGRTRGGAGKVGAREHRAPQTLEETLEILGASQLEIDDGTGETLNDSGVRHLRVEVQKNSPFSRLLERLSERMKKS